MFKLTLDHKNTNEKYEGYIVTITKEGPMAATHETVHQSQVVNQDNTEQLKDDEAHKKESGQQKKKIRQHRMQQKNLTLIWKKLMEIITTLKAGIQLHP